MFLEPQTLVDGQVFVVEGQGVSAAAVPQETLPDAVDECPLDLRGDVSGFRRVSFGVQVALVLFGEELEIEDGNLEVKLLKWKKYLGM